MPLARRLGSSYRDTGQTRDDLQQVAYVGLLKAVDRYDPTLGSFVAYAVPSIRGELKRHFRDKGWAMRVPRILQERSLRVRKAAEALTAALGRVPTPGDLVSETGYSVEEVLEALETMHGYSPRSPDGAVSSLFARLPERQQQIVRLRFVDDLTQSQIVERFGISQMHVSGLLHRSLRALSAAVDPRWLGRDALDCPRPAVAETIKGGSPEHVTRLAARAPEHRGADRGPQGAA